MAYFCLMCNRKIAASEAKEWQLDADSLSSYSQEEKESQCQRLILDEKCAAVERLLLVESGWSLMA
jgi:hypothetical protein